MNQEELKPPTPASVAGMDLVRRALLALAQRDEGLALAAVNTATEAEAKWAAGYLLAIVREQVLGEIGGDERRLGLALKTKADRINEDIVMTQVGLIVQRVTDDP